MASANIIEEIMRRHELSYRLLEQSTGLKRSHLHKYASGKKAIPNVLKWGFAAFQRRLQAKGVMPAIAAHLRVQGPQTRVQICRAISARMATVYAGLQSLIDDGEVAKVDGSDRRGPFKYKFIGSISKLIAEDAAPPTASPLSPPCPHCGQSMLDTDARSHFFHGRLQKCWRCPTDRKFRVGLKARENEPIRLDRAINPNIGKEVPLPSGFRRKRSDYERRFGWVWCDHKVGRDDGCGQLCRFEGEYAYEGRKFTIFTCWNQACKYRRKRLRCYGGKAWPRRLRGTSLPPNARSCLFCGGPNHKAGRHKQDEGQLRVKCGSDKCGRIQYFDVHQSRLIPAPLSGRPLIDDPNRPRCVNCERRFKSKPGTHVRLFQLTRGAFRKTPTLCPSPVRLILERELSGSPSVILAVRYQCKCGRVDEWKRPTGEVLWSRQPGERLPLGRSFKQIRELAEAKGQGNAKASQTKARKHLPAQKAAA